jgi:WD40 repeat protein
MFIFILSAPMRLICIPGSAGKTQGMLPLKGKVLLAFTRLFQLDNQKAETEKKNYPPVAQILLDLPLHSPCWLFPPHTVVFYYPQVYVKKVKMIITSPTRQKESPERVKNILEDEARFWYSSDAAITCFMGSERKRTMPRLHRSFSLLLRSFCCLAVLFLSCAVPQTLSPSASISPMPPGTTLYTYHGHRNAITAVAWSPDGKRIASASYDRTVQVWDAVTGHLFVTYSGHRNWVSAIAWSPDGKYIASASFDRTVQVWDAATGRRLLTYHGHTDTVASVAWSPDGSRLASASYDKTVQVWTLGKSGRGDTLFTYHGHFSWVTAVAWSPDGKKIASAGTDRTVQVWDPATGRTLLIYIGHLNIVTAVAWSPDGKKIASVSFDKTVQVWDATTGKFLWLYCCRGWVNGVVWSPDGRYVASANTNKTVQIWNGTTGQRMLTYSNHRSEVLTVSWSPDGMRIASGDDDGLVRVWQAPLLEKGASLFRAGIFEHFPLAFIVNKN